MQEHQIDLYSLHPPPQTVSEFRKQSLIAQAKKFRKAWQQHETKQFFSMPYYFILSLKWFERWKVFVSYDQVKNQTNLNKFFGCGSLPAINQDIIDKQYQPNLQFQEEDYYHYNVALKPGLAEGKDYMFLSEQMWDIIKDDDSHEVKRMVEEMADGKKVQLYFLKINIVPISNQFLKDIEKEKKNKLLTFNFQFSHQAKVSVFNDAIKYQIKKKMQIAYTSRFSQGLPVKLWLAPEKTIKTILFNTLEQGCKANSSFSYKIYTDAKFIDDEALLSSEDILEDSLLILEMKELKEDWCFFNKHHFLRSVCSSCRTVHELKYLCSCKYAVYCSKHCKDKDKSYHKHRCPNDALSDDQQTQLILNEESRHGVVGLRNLGNTCFMNSGIQCCSHIPELIEYFLSGQYMKHINADNPLGTGGQLSIQYGKVVKQLWYGKESSISPSQLKRSISKFQPMFSGYNQHDSGELITYLLDGLHEDLNIIKKKPYVETKDYDGRPDELVAKEQWQGFLLRNKSKIVETMYGQYRSVLDCPTCGNRSIQFDPFLMCSLPIVNNTQKKIELTYLIDHTFCHKITICFQLSAQLKMKDILDQVKQRMNKPAQTRLILYVASYASCDLIDENRPANDVRSQYKYRNIFVRELENHEKPDENMRLILGNTICHSYYKDQSYRKSLVPYRLYFFDKTTTLKEVHHKLVSYYSRIKKCENYEDQIINCQRQNQPFRLLSIPFSRYSQCEYCGKKNCEGCSIPYDDITLEEYTKNVDEGKTEFQIYWRKEDKEVEKSFDELAEGKGEEEGKKFKKTQTSLYDCLKLFSQTEILADNNEWYCKKCQDHVKAKKQMHIYKAPKILILCLKRFKRKEYFQQKYNILIDFPVEGLDLSEYVQNHKLPNQWQNQTMENENVLYDLFAISNHYGGTGGGHYTAYCKDNKSQNWYDFDDSRVSPTHEDSIVSESAYILFYRRRGD